MRYMTWDIRAIVEYNYDEDIEEFRQVFGGKLSAPSSGLVGHETVAIRT